MKTFFTIQDARAERYAAKDALYARIERREAAQAEIDRTLRDNPRIGVLNGGIYYVIEPNGTIRKAKHPRSLI